MKLNTEEIIKQKLLDVQENVRDFQSYSEEVNDEDVKIMFKEFADISAKQAQIMQKVLCRYEENN